MDDKNAGKPQCPYVSQIIIIANFIGDQYEKLVKQTTCIGRQNATMCWKTIKRFWVVKC